MSFFSKVWFVLIAFFTAGVKAIANGGGKVLTDAALAGVRAAEATGDSGDVKFNAAWASVVSTLTAEGIPVATNAVRLAIEAAVAQIKAGK